MGLPSQHEKEKDYYFLSFSQHYKQWRVIREAERRCSDRLSPPLQIASPRDERGRTGEGEDAE